MKNTKWRVRRSDSGKWLANRWSWTEDASKAQTFNEEQNAQTAAIIFPKEWNAAAVAEERSGS